MDGVTEVIDKQVYRVQNAHRASGYGEPSSCTLSKVLTVTSYRNRSSTTRAPGFLLILTILLMTGMRMRSCSYFLLTVCRKEVQINSRAGKLGLLIIPGDSIPEAKRKAFADAVESLSSIDPATIPRDSRSPSYKRAGYPCLHLNFTNRYSEKVLYFFVSVQDAYGFPG